MESFWTSVRTGYTVGKYLQLDTHQSLFPTSRLTSRGRSPTRIIDAE